MRILSEITILHELMFSAPDQTKVQPDSMQLPRKVKDRIQGQRRPLDMMYQRSRHRLHKLCGPSKTAVSSPGRTPQAMPVWRCQPQTRESQMQRPLNLGWSRLKLQGQMFSLGNKGSAYHRRMSTMFTMAPRFLSCSSRLEGQRPQLQDQVHSCSQPLLPTAKHHPQQQRPYQVLVHHLIDFNAHSSHC